MGDSVNINLITGYTGEAHVRSEDDALIHQFLLGQEDAIINLSRSISGNTIGVSCDVLINGRLARTMGEHNLTMIPPASGYYRTDTITANYIKDTETGLESATLSHNPGEPRTTQAYDASQVGYPTDVNEYTTIYWVNWLNDQTFYLTTSNTNDIAKERTVNIQKLGGGNVGTASMVSIPLVGGLKLVCGHGTINNAMASGTNYTYVISTGDTNSVVAGGVQINAYSATENNQTFASVVTGTITVGLKVTSNASSATVNYWYITK